jgi:NAD(P)-dependent dehydrogenase (short-subunit alcohol dehydrogenase family)
VSRDFLVIPFYYINHNLKSIPPEPDLACTDVCFKALVFGTQLAIHFMRQNPTPGGFIIVTSSILGIHPNAAFPEYCAAKSAVCAPCDGSDEHFD